MGLLKIRKPWILSYNDVPAIRALYNNYEIVSPSWKYGMGSSKVSNEYFDFKYSNQVTLTMLTRSKVIVRFSGIWLLHILEYAFNIITSKVVI